MPGYFNMNPMPCALYKEAMKKTKLIYLLFCYKSSFELGYSTDGGRATTWMSLLSCTDLVNFEYNSVGIYGKKKSAQFTMLQSFSLPEYQTQNMLLKHFLHASIYQ